MTPSPAKSSGSARRIAFAALLAALALIFSYIEVILPFTPGLPGVKLGIANLVVVVALYRLGPGYGLAVNLVRVFLAGLLFSGAFGILYSLAGALLSYCTMILLKRTDLFSVTGVSIAGGVAHNLGQMIIAAVIVGNAGAFAYFPVLLFSGIVSGALIGLLAWLILRRLP